MSKRSRRSRTRAARLRAEREQLTGTLRAALAAAPKRPVFTTLYFAYGSNMPSSDMQARCPGARNPRVARLADWRLHFSGCADIRPAPGAEVWGVVWEVTDDHMDRLDGYEGCARDPWKPGGYYYRKRVTVDVEGTPTEVVVYVMSEHAATGRAYLPGGYYVNTLERGYREFKIAAGADAIRWALNEITALHAGQELVHDAKGRARPAGTPLYVPEARRFRSTPAYPLTRTGARLIAAERAREARRRSEDALGLPLGFAEVDGDARASARVFLEAEGMLDWEIDAVLDEVDAWADEVGMAPEAGDYLTRGMSSAHPAQGLHDLHAERVAWEPRRGAV